MTLRGGQSSGSIRTWRRFFPLSSVDNLVDLMRDILISSRFQPLPSHGLGGKQRCICAHSELPDDCRICHPRIDIDNVTISCVIEPDLTFVSILLGLIENHLTVTPVDDTATQTKSKFTVTLQPKLLPPYSSPRCRTSASTTKIPPSPLCVHTIEPSSILPDLNGSEQQPPTDESLSVSPVITCESNPPSAHAQRRSGSRRTRTVHRRVSVSQLAPVDAQSVEPEPLGLRTPSAVPESTSSSTNKRRRFSDTEVGTTSFPCVTFEEVDRRYQEFYTLVTTSPKLRPFFIRGATSTKHQDVYKSNAQPNGPTPPRFATRGLIRAVCEVLWTRMASGKGREKLTHTQSVYSFLTVGILDSFGLAYTTVAACQLLGYTDVDLALSEDHGWVEFGPPDARQSADVASWVYNVHVPSTPNDTSISSSSEQCRVRSPRPIESVEQLANRTVEADRAADVLGETAGVPPPPIRMPPLTRSWLYVNGYPVVCRPRILAVAAAVTALQPGASLTTQIQAPVSAPAAPANTYTTSSDLVTPSGLARHLSSAPAISMEVVNMKHRLLWLFYDAGCLARYPLGLTNLADLEDAFPSTDGTTGPWPRTDQPAGVIFPPLTPSIQVEDCKPTENLETGASFFSMDSTSVPLRLYNQAVLVTQRYYCNQHVYPYTSLAGYLYRHGDHRGALRYWSEATAVIGQYNHSSEDWEIYRELLEIATQLMPHMFRCAAEASRSCAEGLLQADPDGSLYQTSNILDDPQCLAYLLAFYDNLCLWEEDSPVPVLHVGWVDKMMVNLSRFSQRARRLLNLSADATRSVVTDQSAHSPTSFYSRKSEQCAPASPALSVSVSGSKRVSRRSRTVSATPQGDRPVLPQADGPSDPHLPLSIQTDSPVQELMASAASRPSHTATSLTEQDVPTSDMSTLSHPVYSRPLKHKKTRKGKTKTSSADSSAQFAESLATTVDKPTDLVNHADTIVTNPEVVEVLAGLYQEEESGEPRSDVMTELEELDASPSPPPLVEFVNHEDLLETLVGACDQQLLNPAFLWGMEPNMPFLPTNVAPEDAFNRLLASLEPKRLTTVHAPSLFPTPPNSGSICYNVEEPVCTVENQLLSAASQTSSLVDVGDLTNTAVHTSCKSELLDGMTNTSAEQTVVPFLEGFDSVDSNDLLGVASNDLIDLVHSESTVVPDGHKPEDLTNSLDLELILKADESSPSSIDSSTIATAEPIRPKTMEELIVHLTLHSIKMITIIDLLRAARLNSSAIKLALTAQSQVSLRRSGLSSTHDV
ncbi:Menin [Paragonimus heterotremus]|uniref:Menin n=1 Tax=Paragonimus heterotremus TaxID=100268 RepID=A0A8J4WSW1_9TREM|nr:Menin [Paragonimus heterotremus]